MREDYWALSRHLTHKVETCAVFFLCCCLTFNDKTQNTLLVIAVLTYLYITSEIRAMMARTVLTILIISLTLITFGVTDGQVIVSPEFRRVSECVGRLQVYKVRY